MNNVISISSRAKSNDEQDNSNHAKCGRVVSKELDDSLYLTGTVDRFAVGSCIHMFDVHWHKHAFVSSVRTINQLINSNDTFGTDSRWIVNDVIVSNDSFVVKYQITSGSNKYATIVVTLEYTENTEVEHIESVYVNWQNLSFDAKYGANDPVVMVIYNFADSGDVHILNGDFDLGDEVKECVTIQRRGSYSYLKDEKPVAGFAYMSLTLIGTWELDGDGVTINLEGF